MQIIVMTSDRSAHALNGFFQQWKRYFAPAYDYTGLVCGFTEPYNIKTPKQFKFYSIGRWADYPAYRWSDALMNVLDNAAEDVFLLLLDDYWITRQTDTVGLKMMYDYMYQFQNVIKFDVTSERLFAEGGGKYLFGYNTYNTLGHLDLIKSNHGSPYHLSLWGGFWRRDLLRRFIIPGETAQQIELNGTHRLAQAGDELLVLGSRQSPLKHANVIQGGRINDDVMVGFPALTETDRQAINENYPGWHLPE